MGLPVSVTCLVSMGWRGAGGGLQDPPPPGKLAACQLSELST